MLPHEEALAWLHVLGWNSTQPFLRENGGKTPLKMGAPKRIHPIHTPHMDSYGEYLLGPNPLFEGRF